MDLWELTDETLGLGKMAIASSRMEYGEYQ
jgi:hypothetical protein